MMYQKLVRDNIPAIIEKNGETCVTRTLSDKEYEDAMGKTCAISKREVEQVRSQKAAEKGTFSKKIFLVSTEK